MDRWDTSIMRRDSVYPRARVCRDWEPVRDLWTRWKHGGAAVLQASQVQQSQAYLQHTVMLILCLESAPTLNTNGSENHRVCSVQAEKGTMQLFETFNSCFKVLNDRLVYSTTRLKADFQSYFFSMCPKFKNTVF